MAEKGVQLDRETFSCSICLDLLKDPVGLPCGHSYCMDCIKSFWDGENDKEIYSCPQCRQTYNPRPVLLKNTMLAVLVEQLKKTGLQAAPADHCYAGPEDVACDVCTGRKLKAVKSCLVCLISYCKKHLQPHYQSPAFEKHKLVEPFKKLQENICSLHGEAMTMFCHSDQQCICYICPVDKHKGHITVSAATERTEKQIKLDLCLQEFKQGIQDREKDVKVLQQEAEAINRSADKAVEDSENTSAEMIRLIQIRSSGVKQQVRSQQEIEVSRVKEFQEKLKKEISEMKAKEAELKLHSQIEDHTQFLHNYPKLSQLIESKLILGYRTEVSDKLQVKHLSTIKIRPLMYFKDVTAAVSEVRSKLQVVLTETLKNISWTVTDVDVLLLQPEPKTRDEFLSFSREITPDPNTANTQLSISGRKVTLINHQSHSGVPVNSFGYGSNAAYDNALSYSSQPNRSTDYLQVQSTESLTGRCYWELEWKGQRVDVAVAYKNISGPKYECGFGQNGKSWALDCYPNYCTFWYNNGQTRASGAPSSRIGVYLDHRAGILSFYNVSETMTLLHRVQTTFTEPLYAGLRLNAYGDTAEFIKPT